MLRRLVVLPAAASLLALSVSASAAVGTSWTVVPVPDIDGVAPTPLSVSCAAPGNCVAVGDVIPPAGGNAFPMAESWNGSTWTVMSVSEPAHTDGGALDSVSCVSADYCMAVGAYESTDIRHNIQTLTEVWNGSTWTIEPGAVRKIGLESVSCVSSDYCAAQGKGVIEVWNGAAWSQAASVSGSNDLSVISCPTTAGCYIVDGQQVAYWDGGTGLTMQPLAVPAGGGTPVAESISCTAAQSCTVVGEDVGTATPLAEYWNGSAWAIQPTRVPRLTDQSFMASVSCVSAASCTGVGNKYPAHKTEVQGLAERWNGSGDWGVANLPQPGGGYDDQLLGVSCTTTVNCMAVGDYFTLGTGRSVLAEVLAPTS